MDGITLSIASIVAVVLVSSAVSVALALVAAIPAIVVLMHGYWFIGVLVLVGFVALEAHDKVIDDAVCSDEDLSRNNHGTQDDPIVWPRSQSRLSRRFIARSIWIRFC